MNNKIASLIDHTLLRPTAQKAEIIKLCEEARKYNFASVCVNSYYVPLCILELKGSPVKVCTVVGFPLGMSSTQVKMAETRYAMEEGAKEVDMVINIGALKDSNEDYLYHDIRTIAETVKSYGGILKVILETTLLTDEEKIIGCKIARKAGADFVKTSTGFAGGGATLHDVKLLKKYAYPLFVKASGGIKTLEQAQAMIDAGATRLGTSSGVDLMKGNVSNKEY
ncbi:MAG: deoxyribose-phosphate aldolase [Bacteriovoracaceae bacterium]